MSYHSDEIVGSVHIPHNWTYASASARIGASGFEAGDVGKLARQSDDNSLWMLAATTPTWVQVGGGSGGSPAYDSALKYRVFDHFIGVSVDWYTWADSKSGGANNGLTPIASRGGVIQVDSHGAADDWCELTTSVKAFYAADNLVMKSGQKLLHTADCAVHIGFRDDASNKIEFKANASSGYWDCLTSLGGSTTTTSSVLALDTDWHHFKIVASASQILFYIDGVLEATHTDDIPTTAMNVISQTYTTGGSAVRTHLCDYIEVLGDLDY